MADEDLASQEAEALTDAPEDQQEAKEPLTVEGLATELGWRPQDQWQGDPTAWRSADEFIRAGRDIQQSTSRELRGLREQMDRIGNVTETIVRDSVAAARSKWEAEMARAVDEGDTATALKLARQEPKEPATQPGADPQVAAWVAKNPWFNTDPLAEARAREISERLKHLPVAEQLVQVDRAIRKEFPEHFPAPAKPPPATQTGASRNAGASNRQKGFADMPAESQAIARDMHRRNPSLTLEAFAKSYWQDKEGVSR